jgi:hypothetical protein
MRKRHHLVVGAVGIFLLVGSIVMSTAGVSGATPSHGGGGHHQEHDRDHGRDHHKKKCKKGHHSYTGNHGGKHDKKKCKPKPTTTTTTVAETTTTVPEEPTTVPEEPTTTVPEETTTVPDDTTTVPEEEPQVEGISTVAPEEPQVLGIAETPEVQAEELAFTGVSNGNLVAAGAGLLLLGAALVTGVAQRRREF